MRRERGSHVLRAATAVAVALAAASALAVGGAAARPDGGTGFFGEPLRVFLEVHPALWDPAVCRDEVVLVFRYRENDEELSRLFDVEQTLSCSGEIPRGQRGISLKFTPVPDLPFPRGWDGQDDVWFHVMLFDRQRWLGEGVLTPVDLLELDSFAGEAPPGELDYELLQRLRPLGSATGLLPVGPVAALELVLLPSEDGDAFASPSPYAEFADCDPADPSISPFERERLDDLPGARDNNCDGIVGAAYQRLLVSTAGQIDLPARVPPTAARAGHLFRARSEDVVVLLRGDDGWLRLSHIALNSSNVAAGLRNEDVDAVIAVDRDFEFAPFTGDRRLRAGDLVLSFASTVPKGDFGPAGSALPGAVKATDLVLFRRESRAFELFLDGDDVGLNEDGPEDVDAAELVMEPMTVGGVALGPGDLLLSIRGRLKAPALAGGTLRRQDEDLVLLRPSRLGPDTAGGFAPFLDGNGKWKKNADALALVEFAEDLEGLAQAGDLLVSTSTAYTTQGLRVKAQDVAVWRPTGSGGAQYVARIEGAQAGLKQPGEDVDGVDLDRFAALYGEACLDPVIGDGAFECGTPPDDYLALDLFAPSEHEADPWLADLPFGVQGSWGWDRLRPGSYAFDAAGVPPAFSQSGLPPTLTFGGIRRDACLERVPGLKLDLGTSLQPVVVGAGDRVQLQLSYGFDGTVTGSFFRDANGDGAFSSGEATIPDVPVRLYRDDGDGVTELGGEDVLVGETQTSTGIGPKGGRYTLRVPDGWFCTGTYWLDYTVKGSLVAFAGDEAPIRIDHTGNPLTRNARFQP